MHDVVPAALYVPAAQLAQAAEDVAPAVAEYVPAAQDVHAVAPAAE